MTRQVFYSFHFKPDVHRVSQVRNIGALEANQPAKDNDWETITNAGDQAIKNWIAEQMKSRSCTVVLVGTDTADRKWINHEIIRSWDEKMGVVGIHIHGLRSLDKKTSAKGDNPFDYITHGDKGPKLSTIVKCYNPKGDTSQERYAWIAQHLENAVNEAIKIRKDN